MNKYLGIAGILIVIISVFLLTKNIEKISVYTHGREVKVEVVDIPISCDVSNKSLKAFFRFKYKDNIYSKRIEGEYCDLLKNAKTIKLKTNSDNTIFVYINESVYSEFYFNFILLFIGIFIIYKGFKKK